PMTVAITTISGAINDNDTTHGAFRNDSVLNGTEDDSVTVSGTTNISGGSIVVSIADLRTATSDLSQTVFAGTTLVSGNYVWTATFAKPAASTGINLQDGTLNVGASITQSGSTTSDT